MELSINEIMEISKLYKNQLKDYRFDRIYRERAGCTESYCIQVSVRKWKDSITVNFRHNHENASPINGYRGGDSYYVYVKFNGEIVWIKDKEYVDLFVNVTNEERNRFESKKERERISVIDRVLKAFGIR